MNILLRLNQYLSDRKSILCRWTEIEEVLIIEQDLHNSRLCDINQPEKKIYDLDHCYVNRLAGQSAYMHRNKVNIKVEQ